MSDDEVVRFTMRLPRTLYDRVKAEAKARGVSVNWFIKHELREAHTGDLMPRVNTKALPAEEEPTVTCICPVCGYRHFGKGVYCSFENVR